MPGCKAGRNCRTKENSLAVIYLSLQLHIPVPGNSKTSDSPVKVLLFLSFLCDSLFSLFCFVLFFSVAFILFFQGEMGEPGIRGQDGKTGAKVCRF